MKTFLMYKDHDFNIDADLPPNAETLVQDLELNTLLEAMAHDDEFLFNVAKRAVLLSLEDVDSVRYRQDVLKDCIKYSSIVREIYQIGAGGLKGPAF